MTETNEEVATLARSLAAELAESQQKLLAHRTANRASMASQVKTRVAQKQQALRSKNMQSVARDIGKELAAVPLQPYAHPPVSYRHLGTAIIGRDLFLSNGEETTAIDVAFSGVEQKDRCVAVLSLDAVESVACTNIILHTIELESGCSAANFWCSVYTTEGGPLGCTGPVIPGLSHLEDFRSEFVSHPRSVVLGSFLVLPSSEPSIRVELYLHRYSVLPRRKRPSNEGLCAATCTPLPAVRPVGLRGFSTDSVSWVAIDDSTALKCQQIIPIGHDCGAAQALKFAGYRQRSYPFDWLHAEPANIAQVIASNHTRLFNVPDDLVSVKMSSCNKFLTTEEESRHVYDKGTGFVSSHDGGKSELLREVKYERRLRRLYTVLETATRIVFLFVGLAQREGYLSVDGEVRASHLRGLVQLAEVLIEKYPKLSFHILAFNAAPFDVRLPYVTSKFVGWTDPEKPWDTLACMVARTMPRIVVDQAFFDTVSTKDEDDEE